ncbi:MAG: DUF2752 domain-containing protein [Planctomycetota bacterium]
MPEQDAKDEVAASNLVEAENFLTWRIRILSAFAGSIVLTLLVIARMLTPSSSGIGTHQQLGLPPCSSIMLLQMPCPACGMTTSWAYILRGQIIASFETNSGGAMLAIIGLVYVPASCYFFFIGKGTRREWFSLYLAIALVAAIGCATLQWIFRMMSG